MEIFESRIKKKCISNNNALLENYRRKPIFFFSGNFCPAWTIFYTNNAYSSTIVNFHYVKINLIIKREYSTRVMKNHLSYLPSYPFYLMVVWFLWSLGLGTIKDDKVKKIVVVDKTQLYKDVPRIMNLIFWVFGCNCWRVEKPERKRKVNLLRCFISLKIWLSIPCCCYVFGQTSEYGTKHMCTCWINISEQKLRRQYPSSGRKFENRAPILIWKQ